MKKDEMTGGIKVAELVEKLGLAVVNRGADFETALVGIKEAAWQERKKFSEFLILCLHFVSNSAIIVCGAFCAHLNL